MYCYTYILCIIIWIRLCQKKRKTFIRIIHIEKNAATGNRKRSVDNNEKGRCHVALMASFLSSLSPVPFTIET